MLPQLHYVFASLKSVLLQTDHKTDEVNCQHQDVAAPSKGRVDPIPRIIIRSIPNSNRSIKRLIHLEPNWSRGEPRNAD